MAENIAGTIVRWVEKNDARVVAEVTAQVRPRMAVAGDIVKAAVQAELSGPSPAPEGEAPGERTGALKRSIKRRVLGGASPGFRVGPMDPLHKEILGRLQKGFVGTDAAGRTYHQKPRPVLDRAMRQVEGAVRTAISRG